MNSNFGKFLDEAFAKVTPIDEKHRERLDKIREKLRKGNEQFAEELKRIQDETDRALAPFEREDQKGFLVQAAARTEAEAMEIAAYMQEAFEDHANLIQRIADSRSG